MFETDVEKSLVRVIVEFEMIFNKPMERYSSRLTPAPSLIHSGSVPRRGQPDDLDDPLPKPAGGASSVAAIKLSTEPRAKGDHYVGVHDLLLIALGNLGYILR